MVQYSVIRNNKQKPQKNDDLYEVMMVARKDGSITEPDNPFPVTIGGDGLSGGTISAKPWGLDVSQGNVTGHSFIHKFGAVPQVFTIEPMINEGGWRDVTWPDDWTSSTADGKLSAQFEHQVVVTETGCEVLSARLPDSPPLWWEA